MNGWNADDDHDIYPMIGSPMWNALYKMADAGDKQAKEALKLMPTQMKLFFHRVMYSKYRTPFMTRLLVASVKERMKG